VTSLNISQISVCTNVLLIKELELGGHYYTFVVRNLKVLVSAVQYLSSHVHFFFESRWMWKQNIFV